MRHLSPRHRGRGFTLVEMLVAMAITVVMILALSQAFAIVGEMVGQGRAAIEMSGNLRSVTQRLEDDLNGITVPVRPWTDETAGLGYFEIVDGPFTDNPSALPARSTPFDPTKHAPYGDTDDAVAFTTRSHGAPFAGTLNGASITSPLAEVVWWIQNPGGTDALDLPLTYTIYRRALLIRPDLDGRPPFNTAAYSGLSSFAAARTALATFFAQNDVSVRIRQDSASSWSVVPNTLADLTLRQNRFAHDPANFPHQLNTLYAAPKTGSHVGEDVMVSDALALDVQVFDPSAPLVVSAGGTEALVPSDPGYWQAGTTVISYGAFVDLGYGVRPGAGAMTATNFSGSPQAKSSLTAPPYTYCTWTAFYEHDGLIQPGNPLPAATRVADPATNGFDDDGINGVDDAGEQETSPPYPAPLRGIQVRIRTWDRDSRQVRQATVVTDFIPE